MSNKKQTSVDWLSEQTYNLFNLLQQGIITMGQFRFKMMYFEQQAKEMEKEQMAIMYSHAKLSLLDGNGHGQDFDDYYNETYGGNNE